MHPTPEAVLPFAMAHGVLEYHSIVNTTITSDFVTFAKGNKMPRSISQFLYKVETYLHESYAGFSAQPIYFVERFCNSFDAPGKAGTATPNVLDNITASRSVEPSFDTWPLLEHRDQKITRLFPTIPDGTRF